MQYETTLSKFSEDPKKTQPEDFFGSFDTFITSMNDAKNENEKFKKLKEEEEKRKQMEEQVGTER